MNLLKLLVGWLFLAGLTAAGTYYAMDEVDHRVGLARFQLHEKLGLTRYAGAQVQPPVVTPSPTVVQPPVVQPPVVQPPVVPPQVVPPPSVPPTVVPSPVNPSPIGVTPPPYSKPTPAPVNPHPGPVTPSPGPVQPPTRVIPPSVNPVNPQPQPPRNSPVSPPAVYNPTQQPPAARPSDFNETNERLIEVKSRAEAVQRTWQTRRPAYGTLRPEIQTALSSLRRYTQAAEQALRAGDTATARRNMDQAEKQMEVLKDFE